MGFVDDPARWSWPAPHSSVVSTPPCSRWLRDGWRGELGAAGAGSHSGDTTRGV